MPHLARTALALLLAAWTFAVAAMPPCAEDAGASGCAAADGCGDARDDGCGEPEREGGGDCDSGCALCACCQPPLAAPGAHARVWPAPPHGRLLTRALAATGAAIAGDIFQPPRA